jgi:hypothetical protein
VAFGIKLEAVDALVSGEDVDERIVGIGLAIFTRSGMPVQLDDITQLQQYLAGVVSRADHHADNVRYVVLPLIGAIVLTKDPDQEIKVLAKEGETKNVLWVSIRGSRYAFSYDHKAGTIVMRRGSTQGEVLANFSNATATPDILAVFDSL